MSVGCWQCLPTPIVKSNKGCRSYLILSEGFLYFSQATGGLAAAVQCSPAGSSQPASDYNDGDNHWIALSDGDKQNDQQKTNIYNQSLRTPPVLTRKWDNLADWRAVMAPSELFWFSAKLWAGRVERERGGWGWNDRVLSVGKCWLGVDLVPPRWRCRIAGRKEGRYKVGQTDRSTPPANQKKRQPAPRMRKSSEAWENSVGDHLQAGSGGAGAGWAFYWLITKICVVPEFLSLPAWRLINI